MNSKYIAIINLIWRDLTPEERKTLFNLVESKYRSLDEKVSDIETGAESFDRNFKNLVEAKDFLQSLTGLLMVASNGVFNDYSNQ